VEAAFRDHTGAPAERESMVERRGIVLTPEDLHGRRFRLLHRAELNRLTDVGLLAHAMEGAAHETIDA
jgi:hypothetical protein